MICRGLGAVGARQLEDLAEDVRQPMCAIQALKHAERTTDLLRGVFGIATVPQHAKSQAIDIALQRSDETIERLMVAADGLPCQVFQPFRHRRHRSISDFSVASSDCSCTRCASSAPSTCSSPTGGACNTKL